MEHIQIAHRVGIDGHLFMSQVIDSLNIIYELVIEVVQNHRVGEIIRKTLIGKTGYIT